MKTLKILFLALVLSSPLSAQNFGEIHGRILDAETGEPVGLANVSTEYAGELRGTVTDFDGRFKLKPLVPGKYDLLISYVGYNPRKVEGIEVTPGKINLFGVIELSKNIELPTVEIRPDSKSTLIDMDMPNALVLRSAEIKHNALAKNPALMIASITPELRLDEGGEFIVRGGRPGTSATFLDGIKLTGPLNRIPSSAIKTITVHTGGIPAKYGDVTGGIIVIETKSYFDYFYEVNR